MENWPGQEEFRKLGKDKALEKYKDRIDNKVRGFFSNLGRRSHLNCMKKDLIDFYKLDESFIISLGD